VKPIFALKQLLSLSTWDKWNYLGGRWAQCKTQVIYRWFLGDLGKHTIIYSPVTLVNPQNIHLGRRVVIRQGARLETVTARHGRTYRPKVVIGDDSSFEQNFHLACAQEITIGRKVAITENVGIFDIWHPYEDLSQAVVDQPLKTAPVHIADECLIGMGAVIQPGVTIGRHCVIGANSVVTCNIPDYSVAVGAPAQVIRKYDNCESRWMRFGRRSRL
jgi:acetyltransferase-like isoleucine patch superfamily enzyme